MPYLLAWQAAEQAAEHMVATLVEMRDGQVPRKEKMLFKGTDLELYITKYTSVYEDENR